MKLIATDLSPENLDAAAEVLMWNQSGCDISVMLRLSDCTIRWVSANSIPSTYMVIPREILA